MILFLDIDGVILNLRHPQSVAFEAMRAMELLKCAGFKFVVHSTWRCGMQEEARELFGRIGIRIEGFTSDNIPCKGSSIAAWLFDACGDQWPFCAAIDDEFIKQIVGVHFFRTNGRSGLTVKLAEEIIKASKIKLT